MNRRVLVLASSCLLVLLTSVYCEKDYMCDGIVYENGTTIPLDSVWIIHPRGAAMTNEQGKYSVQFKTPKSPTLEFLKEGYIDKTFKDCGSNDVVYLEQ